MWGADALAGGAPGGLDKVRTCRGYEGDRVGGGVCPPTSPDNGDGEDVGGGLNFIETILQDVSVGSEFY